MGDGIETGGEKQMCRVLGARSGEKDEGRKRKAGSWSEFPGQACEERADRDRGSQNILNVAKGTEEDICCENRLRNTGTAEEPGVRVTTFCRGGQRGTRTSLLAKLNPVGICHPI